MDHLLTPSTENRSSAFHVGFEDGGESDFMSASVCANFSTCIHCQLSPFAALINDSLVAHWFHTLSRIPRNSYLSILSSSLKSFTEPERHVWWRAELIEKLGHVSWVWRVHVLPKTFISTKTHKIYVKTTRVSISEHNYRCFTFVSHTGIIDSVTWSPILISTFCRRNK